MKRCFVFSLSPLLTRKIEKIVKKRGLLISHTIPDFILVYGGDGTFLSAERKFPSIPKLLVKHSKPFKRFEYTLDQLDVVLDKLLKGKYSIRKEIKVEGLFNGEKLIGLNEVQIRNIFPTKALRFSVKIGGNILKNMIGDGIIVSTPFGSTGYYKSLGGKSFEKGIGVAFNNLHNKKIKPMVLNEKTKIRVEIERGEGFLVSDNSEKFFIVRENDKIIIRKSRSKAYFIEILW